MSNAILAVLVAFGVYSLTKSETIGIITILALLWGKPFILGLKKGYGKGKAK